MAPADSAVPWPVPGQCSWESTAVPLLRLSAAGYQVARQQLLKDLQIDIDAHSFTILLGPNGSGKSLFLRLCHGLIQPSSGSTHWKGNAGKLPRQSMVFQKPVMLRRSAMDNIMYAVRHLPKDQRCGKAEAALKWARITHFRNDNARLLSLGQQQQLALARAWATEPDVLFLDEPTASLDPEAAERIEHLISSLHQSGVKIIMATHNLAQAHRIADDVVFMCEGRINATQPAQQFFSSPATPEAAAFLSREALQG